MTVTTSVSHVNFFVKLLLVTVAVSKVLGTSDIGLPMIQINHDEDDEYPDLQEQVHLDDFFWTGSGDGPPDYVKQIHTGISKGKDVIVKTNTVVATVFVEGHNEVDIPICLDCFPDNGFELPLNFSTTDRRYWLLTVISGFYSTKDTPMLEEKLAKLYRLAFTRQQSKHLGIANGSLSKESATSTRDIKLDQQAAAINEKDFSTAADEVKDEENDDDKDDLDDYHEIKRRRRRRKKRRRRRQLQTEINPEHDTQTETDYNHQRSSEIDDDDGSSEQSIRHNDQDLKIASATEQELETESESVPEPGQSQHAFELFNTQTNNGTIKEDLLFRHPIKQPALGADVDVDDDGGGGSDGGGSSFARAPPGFNGPAVFTDDQVRIVIHNVTQITEEDIQSGGRLSSSGGAGNGEDINEKIDERPLANQTEIIYSVFVGGRPVMAVTAANDMKLVSELEVTSVMGKDIFMKAEPYLREPQATPLAPATRSSDSGFLASLGESPLLLIIGSLVVLLLILLLIALLLMGRPKRDFSSQSKRASSRNELLAEKSSPLHHEHIIGPPAIPRVKLTEGIQNFAYENETARTTIPVQVRSRRGSTTSSDNTSDSSVYTPINPPGADVQRILDDKAATLFDKRKRRQSQYEHSENQEAIYTKVVSERKKDKKHSGPSSNTKHKTKRRYLSENRVGSMEDAPNHSSTETTVSNDSIVEALRPSYENFERTEAYNPHNNYHRNKLLQNRVFTDKVYDSVPDEMPTQAINREIIRALQPSEKSSETGSIGSFLSMASVKSFPKNSLPEPLNRVLEPVFVTYYDNVDETVPKPPRKQRPKSPLTEACASIERFPEPKAPRSMRVVASQSDNPDPGVVGPIVWEIHKKRMASDNDDQDFSYEPSTGPIRDPAETRSHYQGLLEGALQMYSSQDDLPTPLPTKNFTNQRKPTSREYRGKSAGSMDHPRSISGPRPSTAQAEKTSISNHSTQPPSPNMGAWGSGGVHQPLVRPLSAGPFHRPAEPSPGIRTPSSVHHGSQSTNNREEFSAAPLIEAIQNELRKFKRDN
ncbi:uncharacterized protein LOC129939317 [Eupeodes corollae]|uniref:uncharacterized protein LOC129939317 n=1 Tax=Eupeodes corollae TaxID=290404 RepID=UPI0024936236|nr:uncharacterized protein LOC129939317 [Eupeodes corollae]